MALVITDKCRDCKTRACTSVCPIDCIFEDEVQLYVHPGECFDCLCCYLACPVEAIYPEKALPPDKKEWTAINRRKIESGEATRCTPHPLEFPQARSYWPGRSAGTAYRGDWEAEAKARTAGESPWRGAPKIAVERRAPKPGPRAADARLRLGDAGYIAP